MAKDMWEWTMVDGDVRFRRRDTVVIGFPEVLPAFLLWLATAYVGFGVGPLMATYADCESPSSRWICGELGASMGPWIALVAGSLLGIFGTVSLWAKERTFRFCALAMWAMGLVAILMAMSTLTESP